MKNIPPPLIFMWAGLIATMVTGAVLSLAGVPWAGLFGIAVTAIIMLIVLIHIVAFDSRKRWPGLPWFTRYSRVLTFYRDSK